MLSLNGQVIEFKNYANGEMKFDPKQINMKELQYGSVMLNFKYEGDADLTKLMFLKRHFDEYFIETTLTIFYMPYSRMDRVEEGDFIFSLKHVAEFINFLNFKRVFVVEPHSDVTPALLHRSVSLSPTNHLLLKAEKEIGFDKEKDFLYFPDAGSQKRYAKMEGYQHLLGYKQRDFTTGRIKNLQVVGEAPKDGFRVIIVDDLSSYGGTFVLSAEKLKEMGATEIYLLVTHAENAIMDGKIPNGHLIDKVFTTNSILDLTEEHPKFKVYDIEEIVNGLLSE